MNLINLFIIFESIICSILLGPFDFILGPFKQTINLVNPFKNLETAYERNRYFLATEDDIVVFNCKTYNNNKFTDEENFYIFEFAIGIQIEDDEKYIVRTATKIFGINMEEYKFSKCEFYTSTKNLKIDTEYRISVEIYDNKRFEKLNSKLYEYHIKIKDKEGYYIYEIIKVKISDFIFILNYDDIYKFCKSFLNIKGLRGYKFEEFQSFRFNYIHERFDKYDVFKEYATMPLDALGYITGYIKSSNQRENKREEKNRIILSSDLIYFHKYITDYNTNIFEMEEFNNLLKKYFNFEITDEDVENSIRIINNKIMNKDVAEMIITVIKKFSRLPNFVLMELNQTTIDCTIIRGLGEKSLRQIDNENREKYGDDYLTEEFDYIP